MSKKYQSFAEFYPFYLSEHSNTVCRRLHFVGSFCVLALLTWVLVTQTWIALLLLPVIGYGFAWVADW